MRKYVEKNSILRNVALGCVYVLIFFICLWFSMLLRFDFEIPSIYIYSFEKTLIWLIFVKISLLIPFGQFRGLLTFFSLSDVKRLVGAMAISALVALCVWHVSRGVYVVPRAVILTDFLLSVMGLVAFRTSMRIYREQFVEFNNISRTNRKRVAIIGAGSAGSALFREILSKPGLGIDVVCFVDDNPSKIGGSLHGRKIEGGRDKLDLLIRKMHIDRVIIAMPGASPKVIRETIDVINSEGIEHDILPSVTQLLHKKVLVSHLRHVEPEDLLGREPVDLDETGILELVAGKTVLVTGAGGSIGSELCRQIALYQPERLLLVERSEPALFQIEQELRSSFPLLNIEPLTSSVTQKERMSDIFEKTRPTVVFHAAAHKHVPLMETQPIEAILNNVYGTFIVASLSAEFGVEKFVLVSTDKAVNPTNVMGATKRLAELVVAEIQLVSPNTHFTAVRFGNVLGSSGSVIPIFRQQIRAGGPVKVTHPDITRYFMSIPEAVGLVLQCARQAQGGEVFVLDMGEPVKIVDLAYQMIQLSGLKPNEDIMIEFTGLRPGEKLFEETIHVNENICRTAHSKILTLKNTKTIVPSKVIEDLLELLEKSQGASPADLKIWLTCKVPEYCIWK